MLLIPPPRFDPRCPLSGRCPHDLIHNSSKNFTTSAMPPLGLTFNFSGCVNPPPPPPIITCLTMKYLFYLKRIPPPTPPYIYPEIITLPHLLVSWTKNPKPHVSIFELVHTPLLHRLWNIPRYFWDEIVTP